MPSISTVVFDIGNVLIRWDPRFLYRELIDDEARMERFLAEVCTPAWNLEQDRGRDWAEAVAELVARHPGDADLIRAFDERWSEMVPGPIEGSVAILEELSAAGVPLYAITNFSAAKWAETRARFSFLDLFGEIVVSAHERVLKPDPTIYRLLFDRRGIDPRTAVFVDDSAANVAGAEAVGMTAIRFTDPADLRMRLRDLGLPLAG
ncbi:HAD family hydrolase [Oharaeibacter diazotrophicus]|uniref:2-haloacid dehalogenase n=1 Tax=Oharaeibacter diazotrophicus TaxID=1920512 RepID=A0A4R6RDG9_9HYPH|nr:HAD family phosphatase [Oharaeibacter diazotrophicus]TDP84144.1 2-haloacid dehalogenase [Oharaeibacter diazotrophicus]